MDTLTRAKLTDLAAYALSMAAYWGEKAAAELMEPRKWDAGEWAVAYAKLSFRWAVDSGFYQRDEE